MVSKRSPTRPRSPRRRVSNRRPKRSRRSPKRSPRRYRAAAAEAAAQLELATVALSTAKDKVTSTILSSMKRGALEGTRSARGHLWRVYTGDADSLKTEEEMPSDVSLLESLKKYVITRIQDSPNGVIFLSARDLDKYFGTASEDSSVSGEKRKARDGMKNKRHFRVTWKCIAGDFQKEMTQTYVMNFPIVPPTDDPTPASASSPANMSPEASTSSPTNLSPELLATSQFIPFGSKKTLAELFNDVAVNEYKTVSETILENALSNPDEIRKMLDFEEQKRELHVMMQGRRG